MLSPGGTAGPRQGFRYRPGRTCCQTVRCSRSGGAVCPPTRSTGWSRSCRGCRVGPAGYGDLRAQLSSNYADPTTTFAVMSLVAAAIGPVYEGDFLSWNQATLGMM